MDISVIVSKYTINKLDKLLNNYHNQFILDLQRKHQVCLQSYLIPDKKKKNLSQSKTKEDTNTCQDRCMARIWNNGYGGQCHRIKKESDYCLLHYKQSQRKGLPHGRIDMPCPKILPKLSIQPFTPNKKIRVKKSVLH